MNRVLKVSSLIYGLVASSGVMAFVQPSQKPQLLLQQNYLTGEAAPGSLRMVAIRNPFWQAFDGNDKELKSDEFIVDRDFSVASTLLAVGIWLTFFGPSKYLSTKSLSDAFVKSISHSCKIFDILMPQATITISMCWEVSSIFGLDRSLQNRQ